MLSNQQAYLEFLDRVRIEIPNVWATLKTESSKTALLEKFNTRSLDEAVDLQSRENLIMTIPASAVV